MDMLNAEGGENSTSRLVHAWQLPLIISLSIEEVSEYWVNVEHRGTSVSKQETAALNCYIHVAKTLPVKHQITVHRKGVACN